MNDSQTFTCIIVDDEKTARYGLRSYVNKTPLLQCVEEFPTTSYLETYLLHNPAPDIIFMDIRMPGQSGLDYIASKTINSAIIIVTAYEQYALKGFDLNVCDYLLKPVSYQRFKRAVDKATKYISYLRGLATDTPPSIFIRADRMIHQVNLSDIIYLKAMENYVQIYLNSLSLNRHPNTQANTPFIPTPCKTKITQPHTANATADTTPSHTYDTNGTNRIIGNVSNGGNTINSATPITTRTTLKAILSYLPSEEFIQIHKSYVINTRHIRTITPTAVTMSNHHEIPLSKNYRNPLLNSLTNL